MTEMEYIIASDLARVRDIKTLWKYLNLQHTAPSEICNIVRKTYSSLIEIEQYLNSKLEINDE